MSLTAVFLVAAADKPGLVGRIGGFFSGRGLNIIDASNHTDASDTQATFFMRLVVDLTSAAREPLAADFQAFCTQLGAIGSVGYSDAVPRVALLVTREAACLYDLVLRQREGELRCTFPVIISNRSELSEVARAFAIPFVHLPVTPETKPAQEAQISEILRQERIELVVLARYMQILSEGFLASAPPVINIHHGFLPAFQGAKPYHQAHARGVKLIGATAHYATRDLDEGPIIEQDVARVSHRDGPEELVRIGRDVERVVLSRAVRAHLDRRVIVQGRRTFLL
jgi:formyltetrahydrofolate deformylase